MVLNGCGQGNTVLSSTGKKDNIMIYRQGNHQRGNTKTNKQTNKLYLGEVMPKNRQAIFKHLLKISGGINGRQL